MVAKQNKKQLTKQNNPNLKYPFLALRQINDIPKNYLSSIYATYFFPSEHYIVVIYISCCQINPF